MDEKDQHPTELTEAGEQYVIPGAERKYDQTPQPVQPELFG